MRTGGKRLEHEAFSLREGGETSRSVIRGHQALRHLFLSERLAQKDGRAPFRKGVEPFAMDFARLFEVF